ncbi:hypothetical protein PL75_11500, partial [Neisseria arctica]
INDTLWLFGLAVSVYIALALASFTMAVPAWSRSVPSTEQVRNLGGLFGASLADACYYLFPLSFWWCGIAASIYLSKN